MARKRLTNPLIDRAITDENFSHVILLAPYTVIFAEEMAEGQKIQHNDRNMVQIPVELLVAFIKDKARDQSAIGQACRDALEMLQTLRGMTDAQKYPTHE